MNRSDLLISVVSILMAFKIGFAEDKPVHIFILSGQSNMAGMKPKLGFEPEAKLLFPDATVPYIKVARGGQPIRYWVNEWNEIADKHKLASKLNEAARAKNNFYERILQQYQALIKKHAKPDSVTFCWMQGERDAKEKLSAAYDDALSQLIANLRRDLAQPEMNFVIGRLSDSGKPSFKDWQNVRKAQVDIAIRDKRGAWVDCDDLNDKERNGVKRNDLHYTQEGYEMLGRRYVRQAKALIEGKEPAGDGRPK
ncbi:MAG: sialate O-acetylesterase [Planctomycetota bacterium]|jgi:hypothetical protein|nr:sialate O-acetylesterase [Planctomycetota bacterium]MDP6503126.1 sialate O-acetylesterase [Planctomycetota bacterium]